MPTKSYGKPFRGFGVDKKQQKLIDQMTRVAIQRRRAVCDFDNIVDDGTFEFADASLLQFGKPFYADQWPTDKDGNYLRFHPDAIYNAASPFDPIVINNKFFLMSMFVEFAKGIHCLWHYKNEDYPDSVGKLREYGRAIFDNYGESSMREAADVACCHAKTSERIIDFALDGLGSWRA
jgi:hypothetical protein